MPRDTSIKTILIIGSGPIIIGQACEFDYSGSQAARSLREEGIKVILINSNPATIMTDPIVADKVYLLPLEVESIEQILEENEIDAVLPSMGGQTALNLAKEVDELGIWAKHNCRSRSRSLSWDGSREDSRTTEVTCPHPRASPGTWSRQRSGQRPTAATPVGVAGVLRRPRT